MGEYFTEYAYKNGYKAGLEAAEQAVTDGDCFFVKFPCKPGDTVYIIEDNVLTTHKCTGFWVTENWIQIQLLDGRTFTCWDGVDKYFNKTIFTDMELALAEWGKVKND